jgi:hypothetical protein
MNLINKLKNRVVKFTKIKTKSFSMESKLSSEEFYCIICLDIVENP